LIRAFDRATIIKVQTQHGGEVMNVRRCACLALATFLAVATVSPFSTAAPDVAKVAPIDLVRGSWRADISDLQALVLQLDKDLVELKLENDGKLVTLQKGKLSFPTEHPDRHFDWIELKAGANSVPDNQCLYRVSGDTLLVIGGGGKARPTRFYTGPGGEPRTLVFTRILPDDKPGK
jgi:hypothetical protein